MGGVLGVDAALDRMAAQPDVLLAHGQRLAGGDHDLLADQIEPRHQLGDRVLDLDARVHLHEVVRAVRVEKALDRSGRPVAGGPRRVDGDRADPCPESRVDGRGGRLLDELLVAALHRAVALAEVDHVAVRVGEHLHLDVTWVLEVALDVDRRVAEVRPALAARGGKRRLDLAGRAHDLHTAAAAPGRGLDQQRVADLVAERQHLLGRLGRVGHARDDRDAGLLHRPRARVFSPISSIAAGGGPIHVSPASSTARAKPAFSARKP